MFLGKCIPKICSKFTGEHPCRSVISIKLLYSFIENALRHGCSPVNLFHISRTPLDGCFCNSISINLLPRIIVWLAEYCRRFRWHISWCFNILFCSNIAASANFSSCFDSHKTKERHGLKISRFYFIKNIIFGNVLSSVRFSFR